MRVVVGRQEAGERVAGGHVERVGVDRRERPGDDAGLQVDAGGEVHVGTDAGAGVDAVL